MTITRIRAGAFLGAILTLAACDAAVVTSPETQLRPAPATRELGDSIPNASCHSGYSSPNGRCIES